MNRIWRRIVLRTSLAALALFITTLSSLAFAQSSAAPVLKALSFNPAAINTGAGAAAVTVNFTATDTFANIFYFETAFVDPTGIFIQRGSRILSPARTPATDSVTVNFPQFSPSGTWSLAYVFIADTGGNTLFLDTAGVASHGFPTALQVTSVVDTTPPNITAFGFTPAAINTSATPQTVTVNFSLTDDLSGANSLQVVFTSPSGAQTQTATANFAPSTSVSSTATATFPAFGEGGAWTVTSIFITDAVGNTLQLGAADVASRFPAATTLNVTTATDTTAPSLTAFAFTPASVDVTNGAATLTITCHATDDLSGVANVQTNFLSPDGSTTLTSVARFTPSAAVDCASSSTGPTTLLIPRTSTAGTWTVSSVILVDAVGNMQTLTTSILSGSGFPTTLSVTNNNPNPKPPVITPNVNPSPGTSGWNTFVPVTVSWTISDPGGSGIASSSGCGTSTLSTETSGTTLQCTATTNQGASASASVTVRIDTRPPAIVPTISPTPNAAGWNNSAVSLSWTATDNIAGINPDLLTGCDPVALSTETAGAPFTCTAVDGAGLASSFTAIIKIDLTPPTAIASATPAPNGAGWNNTNVTVTFAGTDALSGIAACSSPVILSTEGTGLSASGLCTDVAGNVSAPASVSGIKIDKTAPVTSNVTATPNPIQINNPTTITATITDNLSGVGSASYTLDGGSPTAISGTFGGTSVNVSFVTAVFTTTGVHNLCVNGTDVAGNVGATQCVLFAVFDPNGGFTTGGGGLNSPAGSDLANPSGSGPVTFAFNPKYLPNNPNTPQGNYEFHYDAGGIVFKATSWDFLVVTNGNHAQAQGTGTMKDGTVCKFSIDAWNNSFQPGNVDAFGTTIFNCGNTTGNRYNLQTAPITKGSIQIHQ